MTPTLIITLNTAILGLLFYAILRHLTAQQDAHTAALTAAHELALQRLTTQQDAHRQETQRLLQRIQAPQLAAIEHAQANTPPAETAYPLTEGESAEAQDVLVAADLALQAMQDEEDEFAAGLAR